jgi:prepilin-type N-terminal cleavage/methylation domain-containing protein
MITTNSIQKGFTAVELLITLFIASIFLLAGYQLYTQVIRDGQEASNLSEVSNLTHKRLQSAATTAAADLSGSCTSEPAPTSSQSTVPGIGTVTYTTTITCPRGTAAAADLFLVKVKATYTLNGNQQTVEHATYVSSGTAAVPASIDYSDDFASSGALGNVKTGSPTVAWEFLNSTSSNWTRNSGGYASSTTAASSNPMAVADVNKADVTITEKVRSTGNAIYFRVTSSSDWLRLRVNEESIRYRSGTWYTYDCSDDGYDGQPDYSTQVSNLDCSYVNRGDSVLLSTSPIYSYRDEYALILDKSVAGTVTQLGSTDLNTSMPAYIKIIARSTSIEAFYGSSESATTSASSVTDSTNQDATKHGVGYASSTSGSVTGISAVSIKDAA